MTPDRITELAKQVGMQKLPGKWEGWSCYLDELQRFAELVRAEALDEAKEVCRQVVRETNTTLTWEGCNEIQEALEREKT